MHVSAENKLFSASAVTIDAGVYVPNSRNTPASRYAYTGDTTAVGPVSANTFPNPCPATRERATRPNAQCSSTNGSSQSR